MQKETRFTKMAPQSVQDDALLLSMVQVGSEQAMATLFDRYRKVVFGIALRILRDPAVAEDVMQEVFIQVWRVPKSLLAPNRRLGSWLAVLARNRSLDALRRTLPSALEDTTSEVDLSDNGQRKLMMEKARQAIVLLPEEQRRMLEMAFFDGLTHTEIADLTGVPLGTVKTRIRSALLTLRKEFQASSYSIGGKAEQNLLADMVRGTVISNASRTEVFDSASEAIQLGELRREEQNISLNMADNLDKVLF